MIENKYKFIILDGSYLLSKCNFAISNIESGGGNPNDYNVGAVLRMIFFSINKMMRDDISSDKIIVVYDAWGANGYHRANILKGAYKDDRVYVTENDITDEATKDLTEDEIKNLKFKAKQNKIKQEVKKIMIDEFHNIGIPCYRYWSWEADDVAFIWSTLLATDSKKSVIVSRDSDWGYSINPNVDFYKMKVGNNPASTKYYSEMISEVPEDLRTSISLYDWKGMYDSLEGSHNSMRQTRKSREKTCNIIKRLITNEDYTGIEDVDLFRLQYSTFKIERFPDFNKIINEFESIKYKGHIGSLLEFSELRDKYSINVSDKIYNEFISRLDKKFYID